MINYLVLPFGKMAYYLEGEGQTIVFLHGWGQNFSSFKKIVSNLISEYQVLGVDLLGFGHSEVPTTPLSVKEYADSLKALFDTLMINSPIIVAHSFGGRIALKYCADYGAEKLFLLGAAGLKKRSIRRFFQIWYYKIFRKIYKIIAPKKYQKLIDKSGSKDYRSAKGIMRQILIKTVNYDSRRDMKRVACPTYLFWGLLDEETPYGDGLKMAKIIPNAEIVTFYNSGHFCYIQEEQRFIKMLKDLL